MSSPNYPKNIEVYVLIAITAVGGFALNNNNDAVTIDKLNSIDARLSAVEETLRSHELITAHPAQESRSADFEKSIADFNERIKYLERQMLEWGYTNP